MLQPHIGHTPSYVKDSRDFVEKIRGISLTPEDMLVSFDVVSLFTNVPLEQSLDYLEQVFPEDLLSLFRHTLTTTYFQWNRKFYEQMDGVAMGSPLSPVIANFYMEKFEDIALNTATKRPSCWLRYVDDTFVIWSHGKQELDIFLKHLNNINPKIQFTMEIEKDKKLAFLDVLISRKEDLTLGHQVYRKETHTDRYLNNGSNHHPKQKRGVIKSLVDRAHRICEPEHVNGELQHINRVLQANGYRSEEIKRVMYPDETRKPRSQDRGPPVALTVLPYIKNVTDRIGRLLGKHNVKAIYKPTDKIHQQFRSVKDPRDPLSNAGVYRIPCSCGQVYIGTTKRSFHTRLKEHERSCRLGQTEKSAVAEHALQKDHDILFQKTEVLSTNTHYSSRMYREAIEIYKHKNNFNRKEEGLNLNKIWYPALKDIPTKPPRPEAQTESRATVQSSVRPPVTKQQHSPVDSSVSVDTPRRTLRPRR